MKVVGSSEISVSHAALPQNTTVQIIIAVETSHLEQPHVHVHLHFLIKSNSLTTLQKGKFVSLQTSVVITEENNVMVNSAGLIGTTEYLTL